MVYQAGVMSVSPIHEKVFLQSIYVSEGRGLSEGLREN